MENKGYLGTMIDCSRNAVMTVDAVKRYIDALEKMGYNMLMLYTEDTYEIDGYKMFGAYRGRYSKEELKEIVAYGEKHGIELIPCIQTLGHLQQIFRWGEEFGAVQDTAGILLVDEEKTYDLIDAMLRTVKECFNSPKVHIGMDEAYSLGLGKYLKKHGYTDRFDILSRHLKRVTDMVKGYGLDPIIWSDMFFNIAAGEYYTYDNPNVITPEIAALVPEGLELVYWDYFTGNKKNCTNMMINHNRFGRPIWFAGGALTWTGFTPHNSLAQRNLKIAAECCRENGVNNFIVTCWGDDGNETSKFSVLPTLLYAAELYRGNDDMESIKAKFKELLEIEFDDFMKLDYPNTLNPEEKLHYNSPDRNLFYNDPLLQIYDDLISEDAELWVENYRRYVKELEPLKDSKYFGYLFDTAAALCDCMTVKMLLGKRTRKAYESGDKAALAAVLPDYDEAIKKIDVFYEKFRNQWYKENKFTGFEVQDVRLGGLRRRLENCKFILEKYINGEIENIPELETEVREIKDKFEEMKQFKWLRIVSANIMGH